MAEPTPEAIASMVRSEVMVAMVNSIADLADIFRERLLSKPGWNHDHATIVTAAWIESGMAKDT